MNELRRASITWEGRKNALKKARYQVDEGKVTKAGKRVMKYYWTCSHCKESFRDETSVEVDHIVEVGPWADTMSLDVWARKLFDEMNLQVLCLICHLKKTKQYQNARLRWQRKKK